MRIILVAVALAPALSAAYSNLIASSDGASVYVQAKTGFVYQEWFVVRNTNSGTTFESVRYPGNPMFSGPLADASGTGTALVFASYADRTCVFSGSTCSVRAPC